MLRYGGYVQQVDRHTSTLTIGESLIVQAQ